MDGKTREVSDKLSHGCGHCTVACAENGRQAAFHHVDNGQRFQLTMLIEHALLTWSPLLCPRSGPHYLNRDPYPLIPREHGPQYA